MKSNPAHRSKGTKSFLEKILHSILNNKDIVSKAKDISIAELLERLRSDNIDKAAKLILLGLAIWEIVDKMGTSDIAALFDGMLSQPLSSIGEVNSDLSEQRRSFLKKYNISEKDMRIVAKIIAGVPLRGFKDQMGLAASTVNKRIIMIGGLCNN